MPGNVGLIVVVWGIGAKRDLECITVQSLQLCNCFYRLGAMRRRRPRLTPTINAEAWHATS
jgi:hypothetical protein